MSDAPHSEVPRHPITWVAAESSQAPEVMLSILCITYNHADFLGQAIDSFLHQETTFGVEIVIGEDCSTDATRTVAEGYAARLPDRVRMLPSERNLGMQRNFRRTYEACRGKYIAICEGDDYWTDRSKLQQQVDFLEQHPDYVLTFHDAFAFNEQGVVVSPQLGPPLQCDATQEELCTGRPISTLTACFRKVLATLPPELDQVPVLDLCVWSLLGVHGRGKYLNSIAAAAYRLHGGGVFSPNSQLERNLQTVQSYLVLARLHKKSGRDGIASRLQFNAALLLATSMAARARMRLAMILLDDTIGNPFYRLKRGMLRLWRG